jgi:large subunit ribosomal protein L32e
MRDRRRGWPKLVNVGYRSVRRARSLHPSGLQEVLVHNVAGLEGLDPQVSAVRIAHTVGSRSRIEISERAKELGLKILNFKEAKEAEPSGTAETGSTSS